MSDQDSVSGLTHLSKTALPLIGRVGTIGGGIFSLLVVLQQISGEIVLAIEGFFLVAAGVTSAIVTFYHTTKVVDDKKVSVYTYPINARRIAAIVMAIAGILLALFIVREATDFFGLRRPGFNRQGQQPPSLTRASEKAATLTSGLTPAPTAPAKTTSVPSTRTANTTPLPVEQMTDVAQLLKLGNDALDAKKYSQAQAYFNRATLVEATNAQAQFGLGQAYFYQSNYNAASDTFQIALRLNVNLQIVHAYLGWIYDYRQDKAKAIAEYDVFLKATARDDPLRADITDRLKLLMGSSSAPTLTPNPK